MTQGRPASLSDRLLHAAGRILPDLTNLPFYGSKDQAQFRHQLGEADVLIVSVAKSGRTWLRAMLSRYYQLACGLPERMLLEYDNFHALDARVPRTLFLHVGQLNKLLDKGAALGTYPMVHLVRWPIDTAVSQYFQALGRTDPFRLGQRGLPLDMSRADMFAYVSSPVFGVPRIIANLNAFHRNVALQYNPLTLRYEDARRGAQDALAALVSHFGREPASDTLLAEAAAFGSFDNLKKVEAEQKFDSFRMRPGDTADADSFKVRRGKVGGYRDYFTADQCRELESLILGTLDPAYGYDRPPGDSGPDEAQKS